MAHFVKERCVAAPRYPKAEPKPKLWCVRGKAADGLMVTLGRFETSEEAQAEHDKIALRNEYRELSVQPIAPRTPG